MSLKNEVMQSLASTPLGFASGETTLQTPYNNQVKREAHILRVKNYSDRLPRKILKNAVSFRRNMSSVSKKQGLTPEQVREAAFQEDMSEYDYKIVPFNAVIMFDGDRYVLPMAPSPDVEPEAVLVPPGAYDLYLGNPERSNSTDARERSNEIERVQVRFGSRENPAVIRDDAGNVTSGYLEFVLEELKPQSMAIDKDTMSANDIVEV